MAQGDSETSICNFALAVVLGEDTIASFDAAGKRAQLCRQFYHSARKDALRAAPWNCAKKQALLAASETAPLFDWELAFPLPDDFIRFLDTDMDDDDADWEILGNMLMTDGSGAQGVSGGFNLKYIYDLSDCTQMDASFVTALGCKLGWYLAMPITQSLGKEQRADKMYQQALADARLYTSQENSVREWDEDVMLRARG